MKSRLTIVALLASAVGFAAGLFGSNLIAPAYAAGNSVIVLRSDAEIASKCNFDKTIINGMKGFLCVSK